MDDNNYVSGSKVYRFARIAPLLALFLALSSVSVGEEEFIGTLRGVPISGEVVWGNERIDQKPAVLIWPWMTARVYETEIERLGIEVQEDELLAADERKRRELGITIEMVTEIAEKLKANKEALMAWRASPENDLDIYERIHAPLGTSKEEWEFLKQHYDTPEKVAKLRVPNGPEEILEANLGALRRELLNKKLAEHILGRSITDSGARWDAYLSARSIEPNSEKAGEARYFFIQSEVSLTLRDWVTRLIADKELVIENDKFKATLETYAESIVSQNATGLSTAPSKN